MTIMNMCTGLVFPERRLDGLDCRSADGTVLLATHVAAVGGPQSQLTVAAKFDDEGLLRLRADGVEAAVDRIHRHVFTVVTCHHASPQ